MVNTHCGLPIVRLKEEKIWLIGAGGMAVDYYNVLKGLSIEVSVIGRSDRAAQNFERLTGGKVVRGGLDNFLNGNPKIPEAAIVSVGIEELSEITINLLKYGVKKILLEKPGGLNLKQISKIKEQADSERAKVFIAYNRRFYASVLKGKEIIEQDGGVDSFHFEFTEWSHRVNEWNKTKAVLAKWLLGNSSHVLDMAFFMGGFPDKLSMFHSGSLNWHSSASVFCGSGVSKSGALFTYIANWESAGRWGVELMTKKNRLIFRPLEKLQLQKRGEIQTEFIDIDYELDQQYKPGLYKQVKAFLSSEYERMCSISQQLANVETFYRIANY